MIFVDEIFSSIQGESTDTGLPCVFVRLFGCNLQCIYCDQPQNKKNKKRYSVENLVDEIKSHHINYVCITGGEPLLQPEIYSVIYELMGSDYKVSIETNGAIPIDYEPIRKFKYIMDVKCPSSKMSDKNVLKNLENLTVIDEVKFVIADEEDYEFMRKIIKTYKPKAKILLSPMFTEHEQTMGRSLTHWLLRDRIPNARIQIQMHKVLGVL